MPLFATLRRNKVSVEKDKDKEGYFCRSEQLGAKQTEPPNSKQNVQQLIEEITEEHKKSAVDLGQLTKPIKNEKDKAIRSEFKHGKYKTLKQHSTPAPANTNAFSKTLGRQSKPKSTDMSMSSLMNQAGSFEKPQKMILIQDQNGEFIIPERNSKPVHKRSEKKTESIESNDSEHNYNSNYSTESKHSNLSSSPTTGVQLRMRSQAKPTVYSRHLSVPEIMVDTEFGRKSPQGTKGSKVGKSSPSCAPDSGYESATMNSTSKTPELPRSSSPLIRMTAVDSMQLCFDSLTNMNLTALHQFCKLYQNQRQNIKTPETLDIEDIEFGETPIHVNNKAGFYRAHSAKLNLTEFVAMISLKSPTVTKSHSNYTLPVGHQYEVSVKREIIPEKIRKVASIAAASTGSEKEDSSGEKLQCYLTILPNYSKICSLQAYLRQQELKRTNASELEMDILFSFLQVISMMFTTMEQQLQIDTLTLNDLIVVTDDEGIPTVCSHMVNVSQQCKPFNKATVCEKLQMFTLQISHAFNQVSKTQSFRTVETMVQSAEDLRDIKTISLILQYMIWGPTNDEVRVITTADSRKQAFDLWLQLARGKLINHIASQKSVQHKTYMMAQFFSCTTGSELYNVTKLLNTQ